MSGDIQLAARRGVSATWLVIAVAAFFALPLNYVFWQRALADLGAVDARGLRDLLLLAGVLTSLFAGLLFFFARPLALRILLTALLTPTAAIVYFMNHYGVVIDADMVANAVQTDVAETLDLVTPQLAAYLVVLGILPTLLIWRLPIAALRGLRGLLAQGAGVAISLLLCVALVWGGYQQIVSLFRGNPELRLVLTPVNYLKAATSYFKKKIRDDRDESLQVIGRDAHRQHPAAVRKPQVLVLVVGETARADHFSIDGYARDTTPELARTANLIAFSDMHSCGTATAVSVPCMFSNLGRSGYDDSLAHHREGVLDVVQRAGVEVIWLDNNSGCKGVCDRVPHRSLDRLKLAGLCTDLECFDEVLLRELSRQLASVSRDTLIVLHQKGSHGPAYYQRYPKAYARFTPACETSQLDRCSQVEVVNAYDNTIAYTDHVLAEAIRLLEKNASKASSALLYVSDHGESLGENGLYLHGTPYAFAPDAQTHVAALFWGSQEFDRANGIDLDCLRRRAGTEISHDYLFHSVLALVDVATREYRRELDFAAPCRGHSRAGPRAGGSDTGYRETPKSARSDSIGDSKVKPS